MSQPLTDAINALTTYANTVTGASDTTLSDAVATLASGYGGGYSIADVLAGDFEENMDLTGITTITRPYIFQNSTVKTIYAPDLTSVIDHTFFNAKNLETVNVPLLANGAEYGFAGCSKLTTLIHPYVFSLGQRSFEGCSSLPIFVGNPTGTYTNTFNGCSSLEALDFGDRFSATRATSFNNCKVLTVVIIRATTMPALANISMFNGTPFASGKAGGTLYVPSDLISSYQSATNWSTILGYPNNQILAIEGSYYETHYADGTEIPTE